MDTSEQHIPANSTTHTITESPGLRNAWQWLAMITMILDHIGYFYNISPLRYIGRLGMPLYAILFVITLQKGQLNLKRVLLLALLSQVQYMYIFQDFFELHSFRIPQLNIIFGFAIFAWTVEGFRKRHWFTMIVGLLLMWIPVSYGWYLYATLATFYWIDNKTSQRGFFAVLTGIYTYYNYLKGGHWRQLLAVCAPFIEGIKAPRPNKYLYRYFYPGHLLVLAVMQYTMIGTFYLPVGRYEPEPAYYDVNGFDGYLDEMIPYDGYEWEQSDWNEDDAAAH